MPTRIESQTTFERGWIFRVRPSSQNPPERILIFLHGWTGDENSMDIFARGVPEDSFSLFPRGPIHAPAGGYGWVSGRTSWEAQLADYQPVAGRLLQEIDQRLAEVGQSSPQLTVTGFSQGAAMAYALLLLFPHRIQRAAALAGFMPMVPSGIDLSALKGKDIYIAHGTRDETIPVEAARQASDFLRSAGAEVSFCENSGGHKLPTRCFAELTRFLAD